MSAMRRSSSCGSTTSSGPFGVVGSSTSGQTPPSPPVSEAGGRPARRPPHPDVRVDALTGARSIGPPAKELPNLERHTLKLSKATLAPADKEEDAGGAQSWTGEDAQREVEVFFQAEWGALVLHTKEDGKDAAAEPEQLVVFRSVWLRRIEVMVQRWTESEGSTVTIQLDFVPLLDDARKTKLHTLTLDINVHRTAGFNSNKFEKLKPRFRRWATIEGSLPDQKRHGPCSCTISEYRALAIPPPGESLASWGPPPAGYDPSNSKTWVPPFLPLPPPPPLIESPPQRVNGNGTGPDDSHDESMDEMDQDGDLEDAGGQEARRGGKRKLGVPPKGRANATASGSARPRPRVSTSQANGTADPVSPRKRRRSQSSAALIGDAPTRADYNSLRAACDRSEAENHDLAKKLKTLSGQFDESQGEKRDLVAKVEGLSDALASLSRRFEEFAKGSVADARGSGIEIEGPGVGKEELEKQVGEPASEESDLDDAPVQADLAAIKAAADPDALKDLEAANYLLRLPASS